MQVCNTLLNAGATGIDLLSFLSLPPLEAVDSQ